MKILTVAIIGMFIEYILCVIENAHIHSSAIHTYACMHADTRACILTHRVFITNCCLFRLWMVLVFHVN